MIDVLGVKRIVIIGVLLALCLASGGYYYGVAQPQYTKKELKLRGVRSQVAKLGSDIDFILSDFEALEKQKEEFDRITQKGFFKKQGRYEVKELFENLQNQSGIIQVKVNGEGALVEENKLASDAKYALLGSPVTLVIDSLDDKSIYKFMYLLKETFPGHVSIDGIEIKKNISLNSELLQKIALGENPVLVRGTIEMTWRTMIPQSEVRKPQEGR